jgi:ribosomal protein L19
VIDTSAMVRPDGQNMGSMKRIIAQKSVRAWCASINLTSLLFTAACTGGSSSDQLPQSSQVANRPPLIKTAKITQAVAPQGNQLNIEIDAEDPDNDAVHYEFQWYADDAPLPGQISATLSPSVAKRGQRIAVEIVPKDATSKGQPFRTASISLGNTPPKVTAVTLTPPNPKPGDHIEVRIEASDPDLDRVDALYRWFKNDSVVKESEEPLLLVAGFVPGDTIAVEVTVKDSSAQGNSLRSDPVVIGNSLPKIISTPPSAPVKPDRYEYLVKANDSDGDRLTYLLDSGPPGMTIGEQSGLIEWPLSANLLGSFHVKVVVRDNHGGSALQEFDLVLSASPPPKPHES